MGEDYDRVVEALPRLSPEERERVASRLAALRALSGAPVPTAPAGEQAAPESAVDEVLAAVCAVVLRASGERASVHALRRDRQTRALAAKVGPLQEYLAACARTRVERRALLELGTRLLYDQLREGGYPASARTLVAHAHRIPAVVDASFPGYAAAGMLGMILRGSGRASGGR